MWRYCTDVFDYFPLSATINSQVCNSLITLSNLNIDSLCEYRLSVYTVVSLLVSLH